jgi:hypothetical protein
MGPRSEEYESVRLTPEERTCLDYLSRAWNAFVELPPAHPDDAAEFRSAIHACQNILAYRVAKRVDPEDWK